MKVLLTGFDPFGGAEINPAWEAVKRVRAPKGVELTKIEIPTAFRTSGEVLLGEMRKEAPDLTLLVGQAAGRKKISVERVAVNLDDARIPDNAGEKPDERPAVPGGPDAYFTRLPAKDVARAISEAGVPAEVSNTAGTFVCNHLFYVLMHELSVTGSPARGGFIHVPAVPEQLSGFPEGTPAMPLPDIVRGLEAALRFLAECGERGSSGEI
ncbi:MAG: pyroglutamyl-peptidase I [Clostridia bacterium]|nr:pyroglutamyl-peptidase I [Clostridia bacterium]